jgi:hypothetical protein
MTSACRCRRPVPADTIDDDAVLETLDIHGLADHAATPLIPLAGAATPDTRSTGSCPVPRVTSGNEPSPPGRTESSTS